MTIDDFISSLRASTNDPTKPSMTVLVKIGSAMVHADEMLSPTGDDYDKIALQSLINDPEVQSWIAAITKLGFVPLKR